jgi:peptidylprolyl isomerase
LRRKWQSSPGTAAARHLDSLAGTGYHKAPQHLSVESGSMAKAQEGDTVTVVYLGTLDDGRVFDSSDESDPLTFVLGEDKVVPGFELAILGMETGDRKIVRIPPEEGYGVRQERLVDRFTIDNLPAGLNLKVGSQLEVTAADGSRFEVTVADLHDGQVTLDANHPLAGKSLTFHIELLAIDRPTIN